MKMTHEFSHPAIQLYAWVRELRRPNDHQRIKASSQTVRV
jgi:hypothetical protein